MCYGNLNEPNYPAEKAERLAHKESFEDEEDEIEKEFDTSEQSFVFVLWWKYYDASGEDIVKVYLDENRAKEDFELVNIIPDRDWFLSKVQLVNQPTNHEKLKQLFNVADDGLLERKRDGWTDYEKLKQLFTEFGVEFTEIETGNMKIIKTEQGDNKVTGHIMFYTEFSFDNDGKFLEMGAWE